LSFARCCVLLWNQSLFVITFHLRHLFHPRSFLPATHCHPIHPPETPPPSATDLVISAEKTAFHIGARKRRRARSHKQSRTSPSFPISTAEDEPRETLLKESGELFPDGIARNEKEKNEEMRFTSFSGVPGSRLSLHSQQACPLLFAIDIGKDGASSFFAFTFAPFATRKATVSVCPR
jgi:hypothetical protein